MASCGVSTDAPSLAPIFSPTEAPIEAPLEAPIEPPIYKTVKYLFSQNVDDIVIGIFNVIETYNFDFYLTFHGESIDDTILKINETINNPIFTIKNGAKLILQNLLLLVDKFEYYNQINYDYV